MPRPEQLIDFVAVGGTVVDSVVVALPTQPAEPRPVAPQSEPPRNGTTASASVLSGELYRSATGRAAIIARLYLAVFEREPDPAGYRYWTELGVSTATVAGFFVRSPEFVSRYGSLSNNGFLERVYQNVLGRPSDSVGLRYWSNILASGVDRGEVMLGFSESPEFRNRSGILG